VSALNLTHCVDLIGCIKSISVRKTKSSQFLQVSLVEIFKSCEELLTFGCHKTLLLAAGAAGAGGGYL